MVRKAGNIEQDVWMSAACK